MTRNQICLMLVLAGLGPHAHADIDESRSLGLKWLLQQQAGDGSFSGPQGLEVQSTAAAVEAMLAGGLAKSPSYGRALAWLANAPGSSLDSRAWQTLALAAAGRDATSVAQRIRDERNVAAARAGQVYSGVALWGAFAGYGASLPDTALGYGALRSAAVSYPNDINDLVVTTLCYLLPAQRTAAPWVGAWPYALPQNGQPPTALQGSIGATALMLHELKRQRQANRFPPVLVPGCPGTSPNSIDAAMATAKSWLIAQANGNGGFAERNPQTGALEASNPLVSALAIRALALFAAEGDSGASTAVNNARNWLLTQQNADGSWRSDPLVTARVVAALPAAAGAHMTDTDSDGLTDVVEQRLGTQVAVADAQGLLNPNASAQAGTTTALFSIRLIVDQPFSFMLPAAGGAGPFAFARTAGSLPPGLSLAPSGLVDGTPTTLGSYAFDYTVTDGSGAEAVVIGRIDVTNAEASVPLPPWTLLGLAAALVGLARRRRH